MFEFWGIFLFFLLLGPTVYLIGSRLYRKKCKKLIEKFGGGVNFLGNYNFFYNGQAIRLKESGARRMHPFPNVDFVQEDVNFSLFIVNQKSDDHIPPLPIKGLLSKKYKIEILRETYLINTDDESKLNSLLENKNAQEIIKKLLTKDPSFLKIWHAGVVGRKGLSRRRLFTYWGLPFEIYNDPEILKKYLDHIFDFLKVVKSL